MDFGGPKRIRTADPLIANEVLYQLSYGPVARILQHFLLRDKNEAKNRVEELGSRKRYQMRKEVGESNADRGERLR